ncbi:hypothetical protein [Paenibacillus sp. USHLN196]|uniref:hypothetical protein n=1 Tax=Paenibacillus sp. USHLN196 TaxID=3081291 RepID=UPI0030199E03
MINYRITSLEWQVESKLNVNKENIGELIFELKEIFPDFSTSVSGNSIFSNSATKETLILREENLLIRSENSFEDASIMGILPIIKKFTVSPEVKMRLKIKHYIKNNENSLITINPNLIEEFEKLVPNTKMRSLGFEVEDNDKFIYFNLQTRKDNLEAMIITSINFYKLFDIGDIYDLTSENIIRIRKYIQESVPLHY